MPSKSGVIQRKLQFGPRPVVANEHAFVFFAKTESQRVTRAKTVPFNPHLDRGFGEIVENVRGNLDVTIRSIEFEDVVGGGLCAKP